MHDAHQLHDLFAVIDGVNQQVATVNQNAVVRCNLVGIAADIREVACPVELLEQFCHEPSSGGGIVERDIVENVGEVIERAVGPAKRPRHLLAFACHRLRISASVPSTPSHGPEMLAWPSATRRRSSAMLCSA